MLQPAQRHVAALLLHDVFAAHAVPAKRASRAAPRRPARHRQDHGGQAACPHVRHGLRNPVGRRRGAAGRQRRHAGRPHSLHRATRPTLGNGRDEAAIQPAAGLACSAAASLARIPHRLIAVPRIHTRALAAAHVLTGPPRPGRPPSSMHTHTPPPPPLHTLVPSFRPSPSQLHETFDWAERSRRGLLLLIDEADAFLSEHLLSHPKETLKKSVDKSLRLCTRAHLARVSAALVAAWCRSSCQHACRCLQHLQSLRLPHPSRRPGSAQQQRLQGRVPVPGHPPDMPVTPTRLAPPAGRRGGNISEGSRAAINAFLYRTGGRQPVHAPAGVLPARLATPAACPSARLPARLLLHCHALGRTAARSLHPPACPPSPAGHAALVAALGPFLISPLPMLIRCCIPLTHTLSLSCHPPRSCRRAVARLLRGACHQPPQRPGPGRHRPHRRRHRVWTARRRRAVRRRHPALHRLPPSSARARLEAKLQKLTRLGAPPPAPARAAGTGYCRSTLSSTSSRPAPSRAALARRPRAARLRASQRCCAAARAAPTQLPSRM